MFPQPYSHVLPLAACALVLALGGCVAAPLVSMAGTHLMAAAPCAAGAGCQTASADGAFAGISSSMADAWRKLSAPDGDSRAAPPPAPAAK